MRRISKFQTSVFTIATATVGCWSLAGSLAAQQQQFRNPGSAQRTPAPATPAAAATGQAGLAQSQQPQAVQQPQVQQSQVQQVQVQQPQAVQLDANQAAQLRAAQQQALQAQANPPSGGVPPGAQPQATQQPNAQQPADQQPNAQQLANGVVNPVAPFPPLNEKWQAYLDQVLAKWELESGKVQRYESKFKRFQFDPTLAAPTTAYTIAAGTLKYMKPDKGLFKVNQLVYFNGHDKDGAPQYKPNPQKEFGEYWICDGKYVHVLDQNEKKCTKYELPPNMRGQSIHLSPLPFVFGVRAAELTARYWVQPVSPPEGRQNEVWLEVYPRRADDAANYQRLQVVLDLKDWMPKGLIVFLPNWRAGAPHRELYEFEDRTINGAALLNTLFPREFIPADPPKDWKVIIEPYEESPARVATPPAAVPQVR